MCEPTCLFCRFAQSDTACHEIIRSDRALAFLDHAPIRPGHVQIIPLRHVETFEHLTGDESTEIMRLAQRLATVQKRLFATDRVAFLFTGGDIPHAHAHLVPMHAKDDITSRRYIQNAEVTYQAPAVEPDAILAEMATRLSKGL